MMRTFRARNYGCLTDVTASLTPLHAFIGPNDSGKTTLLHGIRTLVQLAAGEFMFEGSWAPFDPFLPARWPATNGQAAESVIMLGCSVDDGWYAYEIGPGAIHESISRDRTGAAVGEGDQYSATRIPTEPSHFKGPEFVSSHHVLRQLDAARLARFDPDALRRPSGLIPETQPVGFLDDRGYGLAGAYFAIRNRNDEAFSAIVDDVRRHFPTIRGLRVKAVTSSEVVLEAELTSGAKVEAKRMSEGLLYYLAFVALRYFDPVSLLLVEEPENGLHPARIAEVVRILRAIVDAGTQVVMATHNPLVINALMPDEVSVVTRKPEEGSRIKRIKDTPDFEERAKIYALGELWIAYANGEDEAPLLEGTEP
jgi:predicted ATPase